MDETRITVGQLKKHLAAHPDDCELYFGGLTFYRLKLRSAALVQVEFAEQVYRDASGRVVVHNLE